MATFADELDLVPSDGFALEAATALIQGYTGQTIFYVEDDVVDLWPKGWMVLLPQLPVVDVTSVISDGEPVEWVLRPGGVLELRSGWLDLVTVTYSHGYEIIPMAIVTACVQEAKRMTVDSQQEGIKTESEAIDDYSRTVTYITDADSATADAMADSTAQLLAPFRHKSLV